MAVLEGDGFVADAGLLGDEGVVIAACAVGAVGEAFAVDEAGAGDGEVGDLRRRRASCANGCGRSPGRASRGLVGLGCVVGAAVVAGGFAGFRRVGGEDGAAGREIEMDVGLQVDGEAEISACGEDERAAAGAATASMARLMAGVSTVLPSPVAP